jgi:2,4-dienoyl-CoA reductase-like NADH-dependent reductase (Old Yellow Enzyme family)
MPPPLLSPLTIRGITIRNRIGVSPMCMYSSIDGHATDWHLVHLGARAVGGAGVIIAEATAVEARGRITPGDAGLWADSQVEPLARVVAFQKRHGATPAIQLAHAGRKAACPRPWEAMPDGRARGTLRASEGGWEPVAPSAVSWSDAYATPRELTREEIRGLAAAWAEAARRADEAGYEVVEVHAAHGYLLHEFHSPVTNRRSDEYGGSFANRTRLTREAVEAIRKVWPERKPLFVRLSCTDWLEASLLGASEPAASWTLDEAVALSRDLKALGVDLIDCSSGGIRVDVKYPTEGLYQVPFAARIRREAGLMTAAVGNVSRAEAANAIVERGEADLVLLARAMLHDPHWAVHAAAELGEAKSLRYSSQYDAFIGPR